MDSDITPQVQDQHPTPGVVPVPDQGPKVDAGDTGATVGTPGSGDGATEALRGAVGDLINTPDGRGYFGHNPDPVPNEAYTVAGVTAARAERVAAGLDVEAPTPTAIGAPGRPVDDDATHDDGAAELTQQAPVQ